MDILGTTIHKAEGSIVENITRRRFSAGLAGAFAGLTLTSRDDKVKPSVFGEFRLAFRAIPFAPSPSIR